MIISQRKSGGNLVGLILGAENEIDAGRLAVILSDLGQNKVAPADAVVVHGAAVVSCRRQVFLYLRGCDGPQTAAQVAAAVKISPAAARARLCDLVGAGDVARTGDDRFDLSERSAAPAVRRTGRPRGEGKPEAVKPPRRLGRPKTAAVSVRGGAR